MNRQVIANGKDQRLVSRIKPRDENTLTLYFICELEKDHLDLIFYLKISVK